MDLVQTPRELFERELRVETEELARFPTEETDELAALYESRGLEPAGARQLAESVIAHRPLALDVMARTMRLDGANADEQPARDLLIGVSTCQEAQHLTLPDNSSSSSCST
jgi:hypothetical protein